MSTNENSYEIDPHIAESYDAYETQTDDVELIRELIGRAGPLRILEPFCGTARILIPLAEDGHAIVGLDQSEHMPAMAERINLIRADATAEDWPSGVSQ